MPSRRTTGRILVGLWIVLTLLYLVPPALWFWGRMDFAISVVPESNTRLVFAQLVILLLAPWAGLAVATWLWRKRA